MAVNGTIAAVNSTARNLYRRARTSGPDFADIATIVRSLHTVLKHLRAEAEDGDSLLNSTQQESSVYARQLTPIVEDTDFTLKQLEVILDKYGPSDYYSSDDHDGGNGYARNKEMEARERDMVALIRTKLQNQKVNIDIFLDTVQLHNPSKQHRPVVDLEQADGMQMNEIKDKVDMIASRLFQRRALGTHNEEEMWQQFWTELVKEGFSSKVLQEHKEVLRAYIRELDSNGHMDSSSPPSVRGLLDQRPQNSAYKPDYAPTAPYPLPPPPVAITPSSYQYSSRGDDMSPKEMVSPNMDNEKFMPDVKPQRRHPVQSPVIASNNNPYSPPMGYNPYIPQQQQQQQQQRQQRQQQQQQQQEQQPQQQQQHHHHHYQQPPFFPPPHAGMPVHNSTLSYEQRYSSDSDSDSPQQLALISTKDLMALDRRDADALDARMGGLYLSPGGLLPPPNYSVSPDTSPSGRYLPPPLLPLNHQLSSSPQSQALFGVSPRYVPPILPPYGASPTSTQIGLSPPPAYGTSALATSAPVAGAGGAQRYSRLAPDSKGQDIPMEAKWTRIRRTLVSPEVLDKAGLRYEARPDFVAVLGVLSKEEIAKFAQESAAVRSSRSRGRNRAYSGVNGNQKCPIILPYPCDEKPRGKKRFDSEDSDSEDQLWDESDTDSTDSGPAHSHERTTGKRDNKYIPKQYRQGSDATSTSNDSKDRDEKGTKIYPVIVPFPTSSSSTGDKASPASTVEPRSILKNRNENRVRFESDGPREMSPGQFEREKEREREQRERRERRRAENGGSDRHSRRPRDHDRGDKDRDRIDRDRRYAHDSHHSTSHRSSRHSKDADRDRDRHRSDRDRERDRDMSTQDARDKRRVRKSVWGETLGAVGIGGAAASLLSVLTEAASGL